MALESFRMLALAIFAQLWSGPLPPDANAIADASAQAVLANASPVFTSFTEDVAALATFARYESEISIHPTSCGPWQLPCRFVATHSLTEQATQWLSLMRWSKATCPAHPAAPLCSGRCDRGTVISDNRLRAMRGALTAVLRKE
jgi:hypothetical protein